MEQFRETLNGENSDGYVEVRRSKAQQGPTKRAGFAGPIHNCSSNVAYFTPGKPLNARDVPHTRPNKWWEEAAAILTMLIFFGSAFVLPPVMLFCLVGALLFRSALCAAFVTLTLAAWLLPPGKRWEAFLHHWIWDAWRRYFRARGIVPVPPYCEPGKRYIFAHFPHAVFPMGPWLSFPLCGVPLTGVPAPMYGAVASVLLQLPYFKHVFAFMGCRPADKPVILKTLKTASIGIIVEGIRGIYDGATIDQERIFLEARKGFVKCAIQAGADLVPVYHLGSSQMFRFTGNKEYSRILRASVCLFWGRWFLPVPYKHDIISLVGQPITVRQVDSPSQEEVDEVHQRFKAAIRALFDEHKHLIPGWSTKELLIV
ncbi:hypothetical protein CVIRNUC_008951 [Coccomyxa viridis]|uniref:Acyltransferase n=1 Tax=Coccomyxa viridis TaxID=1274662 RepID=A0AAV1IH10_9CHLO|nr:hypothetical protein CVIRNUC_008951 [Coccomyxa viridis]